MSDIESRTDTKVYLTRNGSEFSFSKEEIKEKKYTIEKKGKYPIHWHIGSLSNFDGLIDAIEELDKSHLQLEYCWRWAKSSELFYKIKFQKLNNPRPCFF